VTQFIRLRRGLGLKDGPESARAATVSVWLRWGFILSPSARTGLADLAPRVKVVQTVVCSTFTRGAKPATRRVADGERMNPPGKGGAFAPVQNDDEHLPGRTREAAAPYPASMGSPPCRAGQAARKPEPIKFPS
jgi:hypothetical protein